MIELVSNKNIDEALPLIRKYQEFYNVEDISDSKTKSFFRSLEKTVCLVVNSYSAAVHRLLVLLRCFLHIRPLLQLKLPY